SNTGCGEELRLLVGRSEDRHGVALKAPAGLWLRLLVQAQHPMASPKEGSETVASQEFRELVLVENSLQEGEAQIQEPEQSAGAPAGDSQSVKPQVVVVGGPVEARGPLAEVLQQPHTWKEGNVDAVAELRVTEVVEVRNEVEKDKEEEHNPKGEQDLGPDQGYGQEQAYHSKDQHGIHKLPQSGCGPAKHRSKMEELEILQLELSFVNTCYSGAFARMKTKVAKMRRSHFERRKTIIQGIPGFWSKA
ncbi:testis-specific Y-encoded, partial [Sigmodon hispidus]